MFRHLRFFLLASAGALALRLIFLWKFSVIAGDSLIYGDMAKNWLQHGIFALTEDGIPVPTYIRLPGYPAFIALIWKVVGLEHYTAVMVVQMFFDIATCYLVALLASRILGDRAALAAFLLYALNPFTANYVAAPLTETLAIFFTTLALLSAVEALERVSLWYWGWCGFAIAAGIYLRPDAGILLAAFGGYLLVRGLRRPEHSHTIAACVVLAVASLAPLIPWTVRNWRVFHVLQPLAPRYANNPWEYVPSSFNRWVKTWLVDYISVEDIYWHVPGDPLDINRLPSRSFDSTRERDETERLFDSYNRTCTPTCVMARDLDDQFASLAARRIRSAPLRYYLWLPALRVADMWLRPRTEVLPLDSHWWWFRRDPRDSLIGTLLGAINLAYVLAALIGVLHRRVSYTGLFLFWIVLRCGFLATLENPEPRYTLECFPVVCLFAANVKPNKRV